MDINQILSQEFDIKLNHVENIISLIDEGCTIPFIARYRKELTGSCDDQVLREFNDRLNYLRNLNKRKEEVLKSITEQEKLTPEIELALKNAVTLAEVEDIYRPYKPKRKTRASIAIANGLQPFKEAIINNQVDNIEEYALQFINEENGLDVASAIQGACDILAEEISDDADIRKSLREFIEDSGEITTSLIENEKSATYEMYKEFNEPIKKIPSHRILAINRGESEDCLKVKININNNKALEIIGQKYSKPDNKYNDLIINTIEDSFERLIFPSLEREARTALTDKANEQAIKMFESNLKPLLMQPPLKDSCN